MFKSLPNLAFYVTGGKLTRHGGVPALSNKAVHTLAVSHKANTFYIAEIGKAIAGCIHREDGTPAAYSTATTDRHLARDKALIDFAIKGHTRTITQPKAATTKRTPSQTSKRETLQRRSDTSGKPSVT